MFLYVFMLVSAFPVLTLDRGSHGPLGPSTGDARGSTARRLQKQKAGFNKRIFGCSSFFKYFSNTVYAYAVLKGLRIQGRWRTPTPWATWIKSPRATGGKAALLFSLENTSWYKERGEGSFFFQVFFFVEEFRYED